MIYLNGKPVDFGMFPNNEMNMNIKLLDINYQKTNTIEWVYENDADFIKLHTLKSYIDNIVYRANIELRIEYMPYSRMDRYNNEYAFSLKYACDFINSMNFSKVFVKEPHSDVTPALIDRCSVYNYCQENLDIVFKCGVFDSVFFPDSGAQKRYSTPYKYAVGNKKRDFKTGNIVDFSINGDIGKNVLIVDDLCSRGGTFVHSSIKLKEMGAENISLMVAHCENTVFDGDLFNHIDFIYTDSQILNKKHSKIKAIKDLKCAVIPF